MTNENIDFEFDVNDFVTEYRGGGDSPVQSVNGKIGNVVLTAQDVHALPDSTVIPSLDGYATQTWVSGQGYLTQHQDISGKADKSTTLSGYGITNAYTKTEVDSKISQVPTVTKVSELQNDVGYLTQHQDISGKADKSEIPVVPTNVSAFTNDSGYLTSEGAYTKTQIDTALQGKASTADLSALQTVVNGKADVGSIPTKVSDLQNDAGYLTQHQDISGKADIGDIPTKTSDLVNDSGFLTQHQSLADYALKSELPTVPTKVSDLTNDAGYLTSHQDISGKADKSEIPTKTSDLTNDSGFLTSHQDISGKADKTTVNALDTRVTALEQAESSGLSSTAINLLLTILRAGVTTSDMTDTIDDLEEELTGEAPTPVVTHSVSWSGANYSKGNSATSVVDGSSYTSTITADSGYTIDSVTVTIGGNVISGAYSGGTVTIASVTGEVSISVVTSQIAPVVTTYTVTNSLTNCTTSNNAVSVNEGDSYSATITADSGYTLDSVTCTMGGVSQTVTGGVISIANVTGNIVITASVTEDVQPSASHNLLNPADIVTGYSINNYGTKISGSESGRSYVVIPVTAGHKYLCLQQGMTSANRKKLAFGWASNDTPPFTDWVSDNTSYWCNSASMSDAIEAPQTATHIVISWVNEPLLMVYDATVNGVLTEWEAYNG